MAAPSGCAAKGSGEENAGSVRSGSELKGAGSELNAGAGSGSVLNAGAAGSVLKAGAGSGSVLKAGTGSEWLKALMSELGAEAGLGSVVKALRSEFETSMEKVGEGLGGNSELERLSVEESLTGLRPPSDGVTEFDDPKFLLPLSLSSLLLPQALLLGRSRLLKGMRELPRSLKASDDSMASDADERWCTSTATSRCPFPTPFKPFNPFPTPFPTPFKPFVSASAWPGWGATWGSPAAG